MSGKDLRRAVATLALLLATACSGPATGSGAPVSDAEPRTGLTDRESGLLADAEEKLITACMKGKGFAYTVDAPPAGHDRAPERPFGLDDVAWARAHGYGLDAAGPGDDGRTTVAASTQDRYLASLTADRRRAFGTALNGTDRAAITVEVPGRGKIFTSADGCMADARRRLYGDLRTWTEAKAIVVNLRYLTWDQVVSDPKYKAALVSWRTCMADKGFAYASSSDAIAAVAARDGAGGGTAAREREVRTAVADAECNRDAGLARTGARLQRERVREAATTRFARQARHFTAAVTEALTEARALTADGAGGGDRAR
ncbi:hypothetical protein ACIQPQ_23730 [Streptomyces sp. NPDC091281]|uniref:hypothetical protein n=1 Tax=Streptomyces sp. NPDC091281 TaxID=3365985 RepID=UPI0037FA1AB8